MLTATEVQEIEKFQQMEQTFTIEDVGPELDRRHDAIAALLRDREELVGLLREVASEAEWDGDGGSYTTDYVVSRGAELCGEETYRLCRRVLAAIGGTE